MTHEVAIFGGGVAGLSVAHELAKLGSKAKVTVYERNAQPGGKARSFRKEGTATTGKDDLPGEHGFRFFPGYYQHVIKTMQEIPFPIGGKLADGCVADNLVDAPETHFARTAGLAMELPNQFPASVTDLAKMFSFGGQVKITPDEARRFAEHLRDLLCACDKRRLAEFENLSWSDFIESAKCGSDYQKYLADGLNQRTVAASGKEVSARTVGLTLIRIMNDWLPPGGCIDRVLNGPTSDQWLTPWRAHLEDQGVVFELDTTVRELAWDKGTRVITSATIKGPDGKERIVKADSYVVAAPLKDATQVFRRSGLIMGDTGLAGLPKLKDDWMNGIQLYLDAPLDMAEGHTIYVDSEFALTSISQRQFWDDTDFDDLGDGKVKAILSVDICDWQKPCSCHGTLAEDMSREEVKDHVVAQVKAHVATSYPGHPFPKVLDWFLDPAIVEKRNPTSKPRLSNKEGLFINTTGSWKHRPTAVTNVHKLYVASDYVQTNTDLATMEGANEAGRLAARGVLRQMGWSEKKAEQQIMVAEFEEPWMFLAPRLIDQGLCALFDDDALPPMVKLPTDWTLTP